MCSTTIGYFQFVRAKITLFEASDKYQEGKKNSPLLIYWNTLSSRLEGREFERNKLHGLRKILILQFGEQAQ